MNFDVGTGEILGAVVGVLGIWFTYLGVKAKARADKEATLPDGWRNLTSEMRSFLLSSWSSEMSASTGLKRRCVPCEESTGIVWWRFVSFVASIRIARFVSTKM